MRDPNGSPVGWRPALHVATVLSGLVVLLASCARATSPGARQVGGQGVQGLASPPATQRATAWNINNWAVN